MTTSEPEVVRQSRAAEMIGAPALSIVIPTHNRADLLMATLASVLRQTLVDFEVFVVDDGSTDYTRAAIAGIRDPRITYIYQKQAGGPAARNHGFQLCCAPYIMFLDSDDLLLPTGCEALVRAAAEQPAPAVLGGAFEYIDKDGVILGTKDPGRASHALDLQRWLLDCPFIPSATIMPRSWLQRVGGFSVRQEAAQDWELWLRLAASDCPMIYVNHAVCQYRLHGGSLTADLGRQKRGMLRALDQLFARPDLPVSILALRDKAYATAYTNTAARQYGAGEIAGAREDVIHAVTLMPDWARTGILIENLLRAGESPIVTRDAFAYRRCVLANLPPGQTSPILQRRALARVAAAQMFRQAGSLGRGSAPPRPDTRGESPALGEGPATWEQAASIPALWRQTVLNNPAWLANRGVLAIGLRCLLGSRYVEAARRRLRLRRSQPGESHEEPVR
jgi:glycosyltransferase involved in cell wall biosynthesis